MILMLNRTEFVESVLAANMIGAIAVPLNFRLTPTEIAVLVEDCVAHVMLTEAALAPVAIGVRNIQPLLSVIVVAGGSSQDSVFGYEDLLSEAGDVHEPVDIPNDSPALIMYTWHHRPPEGRRADSREPHRSGDDRALHQWRQYQQRRRFRRRPAVPYRRNRQHADRAAARLALMIYPLGAFDQDSCSTCWRQRRSPASFWFPRSGRRSVPNSKHDHVT